MSGDKVVVEFDLAPALVEGKIRDRLIELGWSPPVTTIDADAARRAFEQWYSKHYDHNTWGTDGSLSAWEWIRARAWQLQR